MNDEILVESAGSHFKTPKWKITSHSHHDAMAEIKGRDTFSEKDLDSFKKLGYSVCYNKLDEHGKKVYIHHNTRTFRENKEIK
jgi:hypothetical protein|tara:strand:- start:1047 stop:1295 length:249 start_codon:yes stop_codon:yes gene_type:complete